MLRCDPTLSRKLHSAETSDGGVVPDSFLTCSAYRTVNYHLFLNVATYLYVWQ